MKVLFLGTPDFAVPILRALYGSHHSVVGVVTQPDRQNGRGGKVILSPVKTEALALGLPIYQFERIRDNVAELAAIDADVFVTAAYGQILSQAVLDLPTFGVINVHASLLPKYRGSAPVRWAILNGDTTLGVTVMRTALKVDAGDTLTSASAEFVEENYAECLDRLSVWGAEIIVPALDSIENGTAVFAVQNEEESSYQPMCKKEDGVLTFDKTAVSVVNFVRAMNPWPSAYFNSKFGRLKVLRCRVADGCGDVGNVVAADRKNGLVVATSDGAVRLTEVQLEGGKPLADSEFLLSRNFAVGEKIDV